MYLKQIQCGRKDICHRGSTVDQALPTFRKLESCIQTAEREQRNKTGFERLKNRMQQVLLRASDI
ncbi:uncharacterized protein B0H18DRAFT_993005 [Fomitopsis serialis]|uniref:uncharacterized protein n=1 Tax=Fomitopsis serialis TaxID=139415 RepID=UPI0020075E4C|nr:uncharacterized protein B0H18DRAFT_993005 [Neoantrodia serialis]KAH9930678.1 hypothetical protein B0H18DRAFT_993005 [Neoantrodia serialis]